MAGIVAGSVGLTWTRTHKVDVRLISGKIRLEVLNETFCGNAPAPGQGVVVSSVGMLLGKSLRALLGAKDGIDDETKVGTLVAFDVLDKSPSPSNRNNFVGLILVAFLSWGVGFSALFCFFFFFLFDSDNRLH